MSTMRGLVAVVGAAVLAAAAPAQSPAGLATLIDQVQAASDKARDGDCKSSLAILRKVTGQADFVALPAQARAAILGLAANCAMAVGDKEDAHRHAVEATRLDPAEPQFWRIRLGLELEGKRDAEAVDTVAAMASGNAEALNAMPIQWFHRMNENLKRQPDVAQRRHLLKILAGPDYQPDEALATGDYFKRDYAAMLADAGDKAAAAALVAQIHDPLALIVVSVDPRLNAGLPSGFDGRAAVEAWLTRAREVAASHAGSMAAVLEIARSLRQLGRPQEALATLEAARPDGPQGATFTDLDEQENWWWDGMARTYAMLGRYDEATAAYCRGIGAREFGALNVSQTLNLAHAHLRFGHPDRALATVADFETAGYNASPYGNMELHLVRGCARLADRQADAARTDIAYAAAHERDHPEALMDLLLCADDLDGAAAALIRRLDDPDRRSSALLQMSDFDPPPASFPQMPYDRRLPDLKARADVQAAIARAGGTRRYRLQFVEM